MVGFININKPSGVSSAYIVTKVKRKLKAKCGHMGTLDPLASGVLPIGINQASRLFDYLLDKEKIYVTTFDFGFSTPSLDLETQPDRFAKFIPSVDEIRAIIPKYIGIINQIPPVYSAKMIDGTRSYKLARRGVEIELQPKKIEILNIELIEQVGETAFSFKINCKGGTYIRSLARDFGNEFFCPATMTKLERTGAGIFSSQNWVDLDEFLCAKNINDYIINADAAIAFDKLVLNENLANRLLNGLFDDFCEKDGLYKVYAQQTFWGVGQINNGKLKMKTYIRDMD